MFVLVLSELGFIQVWSNAAAVAVCSERATGAKEAVEA